MTSRFVLPFADIGSGLTPSDGAKLTFKKPGLETFKNTFSDAAGTIANANPVIADTTGLFSNIYINGEYDVVLQDKNNVQIWADSVSEFALSIDASKVKNFATLTIAVADTDLSDGDALNIAERTAGNGGGAMWDVVLSSGVTENTFNIVQGTGVGTLSLVLRDEGVISVDEYGAIADGNGTGSGTDNAVVLQFCFDKLRDDGGILSFQPDKTYRSDTGLTCLIDAVGKKTIFRIIDGNGAFLDFTNLSGSSIGLDIGATNINNAPELESNILRNVKLRGPEVNPGYRTIPTTTTTGVKLNIGIGWSMEEVQITRFYKGWHISGLAWQQVHKLVQTRQNYIGLHIDAGATHVTYDHCDFIESTYGTLIWPETGGVTISSQLFSSCRWEIEPAADPSILIHIDPGAGGPTDVKALTFDACYWESNNEIDFIRAGYAFGTSSTAITNPTTTRPATRGNYIIGFQINNPNVNHNAVWNDGAGFSFLSLSDNNKTLGLNLQGLPCVEADITNLPSNAVFIPGFDNTNHATATKYAILPGEGWIAFDGSPLTTNVKKGTVTAITKIGTGIFDITVDKYKAPGQIIVTGTADNGLYMSITDANTTETNIRVQFENSGGSVTDPNTARIYVRGELASQNDLGI